MTEKQLSLGINVSIILILAIFGIILSLPLRLLLNTNYDVSDQADNETDAALLNNDDATTNATLTNLIDFRKLKRCRKDLYQDRMKSIFYTDYDENCAYIRLVAKESNDQRKEDSSLENDNEEEKKYEISREVAGDNFTEDTEEVRRARRMKSIPIAGNILVIMLLVSAIAAFIEVLRIRFSKDKNKESFAGGGVNSRKGSTVDLPVERRFISREPVRSQKSFEMQGMHRSPLRLLGARPPPLIRRSSFPIQQQSVPSISGTPNRASRRPSAEADEEIGVLISALHRRTRLIRRH